jgi:predicted dehydrogenase
MPDAVELVGLCDVTDASIDRLIEKSLPNMAQSDLPPRFGDPEAMYNKLELDAVIIATPHTLHAEHCEQALNRGVHVLVEKPMVTSLPDALKLQRLTEQTERVLCVAYNTPCAPEFRYLQKVRREKTFGELKLISLWCSQPWYHMTKGLWRQQPHLSGGGMLYDTGAHVLNSMTWTVEQDVQSVHALVDNLDSDVDINGTVNVQFAGGTFATATICGESVMGSGGAFIFERGIVEIDPWNAGYLRVTGSEKDNLRNNVAVEPTLDDTGGTTPFSNFVQVLQGKTTPATSVRHGVIQSQLMDAIYESARTGQPASPHPQG